MMGCAQPSSALSGVEPADLEKLRSGLRLIALRSLGDLQAAEEAAQETLARALVALERDALHEREHLAAFVRGIARHVVTDMLRARCRALSAADAAEPASSDPDALAVLISREEAEAVRAALAELPAAERELLRLSFYEGLTPRELAKRLGEPSTRLRKRKSRALARLRSVFLNAAGHDSAGSATEMRAGTFDLPASERVP